MIVHLLSRPVQEQEGSAEAAEAGGILQEEETSPPKPWLEEASDFDVLEMAERIDLKDRAAMSPDRIRESLRATRETFEADDGATAGDNPFSYAYHAEADAQGNQRYKAAHIELPELFRMSTDLMEGRYPWVIKRLAKRGGQFTLGQFHAAGQGTITLRADIFRGPTLIEGLAKPADVKATVEMLKAEIAKGFNLAPQDVLVSETPEGGKVRVRIHRRDPRSAERVLAHEIGHLVDYLPEHMVRGRGNILGRIASMKHFSEKYLSEAPGLQGR